MTSTAALLDQAIDRHRAGRLQEALDLYGRILRAAPRHADALHLSGVAAHQSGNSDLALERIQAAIAVNPRFPAAHNSLGTVLADLGRYEAAARSLATAIDQDPAYAEAHSNLGTVLQALGRRQEAAEAYDRALELAPGSTAARLNLGLLYRDAGRLDLAARCFHELLRTAPGHVPAWRHLALALRGLRHPDAEPCLRRALADAPADPELGRELGGLLAEQGRTDEALAVLETAAATAGADQLVLFTLGTVLQSTGRLAAAADRYEQALALGALPGAFNNLGVVLLDLERHERAVPALRAAVALQPDDPVALNNLGTAHDGLHALDAAETCYRRSLMLRPDYGKALNNLGGVYKAWHLPARAVELRRKAIAAQPDYPDSYTNLGSQLQDLDRLQEADLALRRALRIDPDNADAHTARGLVLSLLGQTGAAEAAHRKAIALRETLAEAHANLGMLLWQASADAPAARASLDRALELDPDLGPAHLNRGMVRLALGEIGPGWDDYEWRFRAKGYEDRPLAAPLWRGEELSGRRLLVWREQGVGDEILFASCYPDLIRRVGHLVIECDRRLVPLFQRSFPAATVRSQSIGTDGRETIVPPDCDAHLPAGSLPQRMRRSLADYAEQAPWLVPDPMLVDRWRERLDALGPGLRVGIGWRSQVMTTERRAAYTALADWGAIFAIPGIIFVNLQYGDCEAELRQAEERFGVRIHRWPDLNLKDDFDGTAALTASLDLVLSPAMSVGELAGALGVPVWRFCGMDWTQLGTGVRPWFPTMRLFQPQPGETLPAVLERIARTLRHTLAEATCMPAGEASPPSRDVETELSRAIALYREGDAAAAERLARDLLADVPDQPVALHLAGLITLRRGEAAEAAGLLARAVAADPGNGAGHAALADALQALGRMEAAERALRHAAAAQPDNAGVLVNRAVLLIRLGREEEARCCILRALRLRPDLPLAHTHLGNLANSLSGDLVQAAACHRRALALDPAGADALSNLGIMLYGLDRFVEAERLLTRATLVDPGFAEAWTNRGNALDSLGRVAEAEACHRRAADLRPDLPEPHVNLGLLLRRAGRPTDAAEACRQAIARDGRSAQAHYNLAHLLLEDGQLRAGWTEHEWRFATPQFLGQRRRFTAARAWKGENVSRSRLLVWREQGVGDEILFASCYGELLNRAGHLVIECDRRLASLFARSFPGATVRAETVDPRDIDVQVAAGSLPRLLRPELRRFPDRPSWLVPDPALVEAWRERLAALGPGLRVGIAWRSQLVTAERRGAYATLEAFAPLFAVPGLTFVNLQYGECEAELQAAEDRFGRRIHRWADLNLKDDFEGAAALTANLDLVISPAVSAGELAGALGVPVWRFCGPDWTQLGTAVRPWFPSMRLFQPQPGEALPEVVGRMAAVLRRTGEEPAPPSTPLPSTLPPSTPSAPDDPDRLLAAAAEHHRAGRLGDAAPLYERVLRLRPGDPVALHLSGLLLHQTGDSAAAEPSIAAAVAAEPGYAAAHASLGSVRLALGRPGDAIRALRAGLALRPDDAALLTNLGNALDRSGRLEEAASAHRRAALADPALPQAADNLGTVLLRLGRIGEAAAAHRQALALAADLDSAWQNLSVALRRQGRLDEACRAVARALALDPALAEAMANLGRLLREMGHFARAERWCDRALRLDPGQPAALFNKSLLCLTRGALSDGWAGYDRRFDGTEMTGGARQPGVPLWRGERLDRRRILVSREQGIGDEVMFAGCLPDLIARAGHVVVECDPRFVPLFGRSFPQATIRPAPDRQDEPAEGVDLHIPIGSLPRRLRRSLAAFPSREAGYLRAAPQRVALWRDRLAALGPGLKVGVAWRSGLLTAERMPDYTRLEDWGPVLAIPGVHFVTLQYGDCAAELEAARRRFGTAPAVWDDLDLRNDLEGAAALTAALDLVIAPAVSTGELAGALGVPVWRFGRAGDWTTLGTAVRPWFPSMRLFLTRADQTVADLLPEIARVLSSLGSGR
ncbi:tetratricopeptide repeat protein [Azospirillum thermophilum]|uniref:Bacterial transcriptional activator domain-containing protein n=1 Tax=Azospirillum thermophilum TaxID=2202148 RepID=A0A2S2CMU5_9PROT|nr:tetratricopeptide repeat protein [Azospirillum thermophilum]AWK85853.1 hypothetical protein DEW08_04295 [Azospirillum thermophilum]